uniref:Uncharacterized protein n=1 Tax=Solanum demissum TaxID=50514 RepID=Q0KIP1_SOLDE|nr:hypothetical protein SDM1_42t00016 [Solanum demissum]
MDKDENSKFEFSSSLPRATVKGWEISETGKKGWDDCCRVWAISQISRRICWDFHVKKNKKDAGVVWNCMRIVVRCCCWNLEGKGDGVGWYCCCNIGVVLGYFGERKLGRVIFEYS